MESGMGVLEGAGVAAGTGVLVGIGTAVAVRPAGLEAGVSEGVEVAAGKRVSAGVGTAVTVGSMGVGEQAQATAAMIDMQITRGSSFGEERMRGVVTIWRERYFRVGRRITSIGSRGIRR